MKALGLLHPLFAVSAIVATGNHRVLDAVGGAVVVSPGSGTRKRNLRAKQKKGRLAGS
ncbi:hypothetical protein SCANM63S_01659 [Streptomyces canarius]